jgi:calpain-7
MAFMEERSKNKYITNRLYPQDSNGVPIYNPTGKYHYKLYVNGEDRCVGLDDRVLVKKKNVKKYDKLVILILV